MSDHFNSLLMNDVLIRLEEQSFFADIGEERTLRFVQDALALCRDYDGNPGEALAGIGTAPGHVLLLLGSRHGLAAGNL